MTTTVRIKNLVGNRAIKVGTMNIKDFDDVSNADIVRSGFTILSPGESIDLPVYDTQQLLVSETGDFLD